MPIINDGAVVIEAQISNEEQRLVVVQDGNHLEVLLEDHSIDVVLEDASVQVNAVVEEHPLTEVRIASPVGLPGKSAYDVAVDHGFIGTEADWVAASQADRLAAEAAAADAIAAADSIDVSSVNASYLNGVLIDAPTPGERNVLQFKSGAWRASPQRDIVDGGNF